MNVISRRTFLGASAAIAGAYSLGNTSVCSAQQTTHKHLLEGIERENIKITNIKVTPLSYEDPKGNLWRSGNSMVWKTDAALCEVFTDQGIVGIGGGSPYAGADNIKKYTEEFIKPALIGKNPFDVELLTRRDSVQTGRNARVPFAALAGVDCALWDIIGKAKNMPVYKLLATDNEPDTHIPIYASGGDYHEWYNNGEEVLIEEALSYKEEGYTAFKFRTGTNWAYSNMTLKKYIPIMRRLREAVGPDFKLIHEAFWGILTPEQVIKEFCPVLEELKFYWFEEPLRGIENRIKVNEALSTVMVSGGESFRTKAEAKEWIDRNALDIIQTDCNNIGITDNWYISRMANLKGVLHCPHNWAGGLTTMANAHFSAGIPNRHMLELNQTYNPLKEGVFKEPLVVKNGYMDLPDKPGFGVEVIDDIEKKFPWVPGRFNKPNPLIPERFRKRR